MAAAYWYTFEVGLCLEDDEKTRKVLGGAVLSSIEESELALSGNAKVIDFNIDRVTSETSCKSIQYSGIQPYYVLSPPLKELCVQLDAWTDKILDEKPFFPSYNPVTRDIDVRFK